MLGASVLVRAHDFGRSLEALFTNLPEETVPARSRETGYGMDHEQVSAVKVSSGELLTGYYDDVHQQTLDFVRRLPDSELTRIVDERWSPPVQLGVRLISERTRRRPSGDARSRARDRPRRRRTPPLRA